MSGTAVGKLILDADGEGGTFTFLTDLDELTETGGTEGLNELFFSEMRATGVTGWPTDIAYCPVGVTEGGGILVKAEFAYEARE